MASLATLTNDGCLALPKNFQRKPLCLFQFNGPPREHLSPVFGLAFLHTFSQRVPLLTYLGIWLLFFASSWPRGEVLSPGLSRMFWLLLGSAYRRQARCCLFQCLKGIVDAKNGKQVAMGWG